MAEAANNHTSYGPELDLRQLISSLWEGKAWIVGSASVACVLGILVAILLTDVYRADTLLAPNDQDSGAGLSNLASQYGAIASLAGINLGAGSNSKVTLGLEVLKSRKFVTDFINRHELLVPLMAADNWDPDSDELVIDPDQFDIETKEWVRDESSYRARIPTNEEAYEEFVESLSVEENSNTGMTKVSFEHVSPVVARDWVDLLIKDLNQQVMRRDVEEAEQAIAYLNQQIATTPLADVHSVFFDLIEEQTKKVMLAKVSDEYLFRVIDPAVVSEKPIRPKRVLIVILATAFGLTIGMLLALFMSPRKKLQKS